MRATGIYNDVDIETYHKEEGISSSGISLILDCPKRYWHEYISPKPPLDPKEAQKQRDKFRMGRAIHMKVLEPELFDKTFFLMHEEVNLTTKVGKEVMEKAVQAANGREVLRFGDWQDIMAIANSVSGHSLWSKLGKSHVEHSIYWDVMKFGEGHAARLRSRPDLFTDHLIIDLKTTDSIANFSKSIHTYGYHRQAAMQIDGLKSIDGKQRTFAFFVVEKKAPYLTSCFVLDEASIEQGRREYYDGVMTYHECMETGVWPGYEEKFQIISLPTYAIKGDEL